MLAAARALQAGASVPATAREASVSPRELRRRFHTHLGYGPKAFARVVRFRRFVSQLRTTTTAQLSLARLAAELGYADQAHLSLECRLLSGSTPSDLAVRCVA